MRDNFKGNARKIEEIIGYSFRNKELLAQAFTRTSFCNECGKSGGIALQSNEVLEFFGDSVLSCAIVTALIEKCSKRYNHGIRTELNEGDFSNIKSKLSDKKNLSEAIRRLGLASYLRMGEGDVKQGIYTEPSVMEDLFESIIGAIFIDSDKDMSKVLVSVHKMLDLDEYIKSAPPVQSAKNALQEWCDSKKNRLEHPVYKTISEAGPDHKKEYERGCYIGDRLVASAKGKNLKIADAMAAEAALAILRAEAAKKDNQSLHSSKKAKSEKKEKESKKTQHGTFEQKKKAVANERISEVADATAKLRSYAASKGIPSPRYRDLGMILKDGVAMHKIECCLGDVSTVGVGEERIAARQSAASLMCKKLSVGKKK